MWFRENRLEQSVREAVETVVTKVLTNTDSALHKLRQVVDFGAEVLRLKEEIETLKIEKGRTEEEFARKEREVEHKVGLERKRQEFEVEFARKEREVEHKVGLERKRQEFEVEAAKREATLSVREENLKADRKRFEDQMAFHEKRFNEEVTYLKDMVGQVLERLPNVTVAGTLRKGK